MATPERRLLWFIGGSGTGGLQRSLAITDELKRIVSGLRVDLACTDASAVQARLDDTPCVHLNPDTLPSLAEVIGDHRPDAVVVDELPQAFLAALERQVLALCLSHSLPGAGRLFAGSSATRLLAGLSHTDASRAHVVFPGPPDWLGPVKARLSGRLTCLPGPAVAAPRSRSPELKRSLGLPPSHRVVLVTGGGGTRGHHLFRCVQEMAGLFRAARRDVHFHAVLGPGAASAVAQSRPPALVETENLTVRGYVPGLSACMEHVDLVVCHGGYNTVFEAGVCGRVPVLVCPDSKDAAQRLVARWAAAAGLARVVPGRRLTGRRLARETAALLGDEGSYRRMRSAAHELSSGTGQAAEAIALFLADACERTRLAERLSQGRRGRLRGVWTDRPRPGTCSA